MLDGRGGGGGGTDVADVQYVSHTFNYLYVS